jgi:hypothetical protein
MLSHSIFLLLYKGSQKKYMNADDISGLHLHIKIQGAELAQQNMCLTGIRSLVQSPAPQKNLGCYITNAQVLGPVVSCWTITFWILKYILGYFDMIYIGGSYVPSEPKW